ncbi:MAG: ROK family protein [Candidatus Poribacteria bacterium]
MSIASNVISIDIGGTKIKSAIVSNGKVMEPLLNQTETSDHKAIIEQIVNIIGSYQKRLNMQIDGVGIAIAGAIDHQSGNIIESPNLPFPKGFHLKPELETIINKSVYVGSELKMAALGELYYGAARGKQNVVVITIGTGVGAAVIINGNLYHGSHNIAGEIGHTCVDSSNEAILCSCGRTGCIEAYTSGPSLILKMIRCSGMKDIQIAKRIDKGIKPKDILQDAIKGNQIDKKALDETAFYIGICVANVRNYYDPEIIIFRGGFIENIWEYIKNAVEDETRKRVMSDQEIPLVLSELGGDSVLLGVASAIQ